MYKIICFLFNRIYIYFSCKLQQYETNAKDIMAKVEDLYLCTRKISRTLVPWAFILKNFWFIHTRSNQFSRTVCIQYSGYTPYPSIFESVRKTNNIEYVRLFGLLFVSNYMDFTIPDWRRRSWYNFDTFQKFCILQTKSKTLFHEILEYNIRIEQSKFKLSML